MVVIRLHIPTSLLWTVVSVLATFLRPLASLRSGQWSISWFKFSTCLVCCLHQSTHSQPRSESSSSQMILWGPFLISSLLTTSLVLVGSLGLPLFLVLWLEHWGCICLAVSCMPQLRPCPRPKVDGQEKREAVASCPHPLETTVTLTEEFRVFMSWLPLLSLPENSFPSFLSRN